MIFFFLTMSVRKISNYLILKYKIFPLGLRTNLKISFGIATSCLVTISWLVTKLHKSCLTGSREKKYSKFHWPLKFCYEQKILTGLKCVSLRVGHSFSFKHKSFFSLILSCHFFFSPRSLLFLFYINVHLSTLQIHS